MTRKIVQRSYEETFRENLGARFGRLTVIGWGGLRGTQPRWVVRCDCGTEKTVSPYAIMREESPTRSCGCQKNEWVQGGWKIVNVGRPSGNRTHGRSKTPEYMIWQAMRNRCSNPRVIRRSGDKGVRAVADFRQFLRRHGRAAFGESFA